MMRQIVVISQSRAGLVADICEILASRHINIETLDASGSQDTAMVQLTCDSYEEALEALRQAGIETVAEDAVLLRLPDEPGTLAEVARRVKDAGIDLRSVRIVGREPGYALVALAGDRSCLVGLVGEYLIHE